MWTFNAKSRWISKFPSLNLRIWLKPRGLNQLLERLVPEGVKRHKRLVEASVLERAKTEASIRDPGSKRQEVRRDMFNARDEGTGKPAYSLDNLGGEAQMLIVAGSDTTSVTFSAFFFSVVRNSLPCEILTSEKTLHIFIIWRDSGWIQSLLISISPHMSQRNTPYGFHRTQRTKPSRSSR